MLQDTTSRLLYILFFVTLLFGILLYNIIRFKGADELCALLLLVIYIYHVFNTKDWDFSKGFLTTLALFLFYLIYSITIQSNSTKGILFDLIIQLKPYLAFFTMYQMAPIFSQRQKTILKQTCILAWWILLPIGLLGLPDEGFFRKVMEHPTNFATCIMSLSMVYLLFSNYTQKEKIVFILMLAIGLASGRSKFYGFFVLATALIFYLNKPERLKLNFKTASVLCVVLVGMFVVAYDKLQLYFITAATGEEEDLKARAVLYVTSFDIFKDYMPFGSGLASFGTHASAVFYSKTYEEYGIDTVWGLSKQMSSFIADTYYPSLAQFGVFGACCFIFFWIYIIVKSYKYFKKGQDIQYFLLTILITCYLAIENVAEASFTSNKGFFMMMLLGLILGVQNNKSQEIENKNNIKIHE